MFDPEDNLFLLAGPVRMHPRVTRAMDVPAVAHRGPEFTESIRGLIAKLQQVYRTQDPVLPLTMSGTGAMDMALGSALGKETPVVALTGGKFNDRMAKLSQRYGRATAVPSPWGQPPGPDEVAAAMDRAGAQVLAFTHNETSTGTVFPLGAYARIARERDALLIVDCITSLGGVDLPVAELGLDGCITGSQKCLGGPAGLAFLSVSPRLESRARDHPALYLDLKKHVAKAREGQTPFTPATHLVLAMNAALELILEEGLEARTRRIGAQARGVRAAMEALGLELFSRADARSDTVTAVRYPAGVKDADFRGWLKARGVVVAGGQDEVKGKIFRIGHMGTVRHDELAAGAALVGRALAAQGFKCRPGAAVDAYLDAAEV